MTLEGLRGKFEIKMLKIVSVQIFAEIDLQMSLINLKFLFLFSSESRK